MACKPRDRPHGNEQRSDAGVPIRKCDVFAAIEKMEPATGESVDMASIIKWRHPMPLLLWLLGVPLSLVVILMLFGVVGF
jgi:hypothetical protein